MRTLPSASLAALLAAAQMAAAQPAAQTPDNDGARPGNIIGTGMSLPRSDQASNLNPQTTHSEIAPNLPSPKAGESVAALLQEAGAALRSHQTGLAQEALERAETRALDRSIPYGTERQPSQAPAVLAIDRALQSLAANDMSGALTATAQAEADMR